MSLSKRESRETPCSRAFAARRASVVKEMSRLMGLLPLLDYRFNATARRATWPSAPLLALRPLRVDRPRDRRQLRRVRLRRVWHQAGFQKFEGSLQETGFRKVEIKNGLLYVNGK